VQFGVRTSGDATAGCDDHAVLHRLMLGFALAGLVTACALVEPAPPAGTAMLQFQVSNQSAQPAEVAVRVGGRELVGAAQPATVPPRATVVVSFYVPISGEWAIFTNGGELMGSRDVRGRLGARNDIGITIDGTGSLSWWCNRQCP
jgi:hypothetical protein